MKPKINIGLILLSSSSKSYTQSYMEDNVLFIAEHETEGSVAFALNKPSALKINDAIPDWPPFDSDVFFGGDTASQTIHFLHTCRHLEDAKYLTNGIYWGGNTEQLKQGMLEGTIRPKDICFFSGYYEWKKRDLENEISRCAFAVVGNMEREYFNSKPEEMYEMLSKKINCNRYILSSVPAICYN